jgi:hypothetical protein
MRFGTDNTEQENDPAIADEQMTNKVMQMMNDLESDQEEVQVKKSKKSTVIDDDEDEDELFNQLLANNNF